MLLSWNFRTPTNTEFQLCIFLRVSFPLCFEFAFQILQDRNNMFFF